MRVREIESSKRSVGSGWGSHAEFGQVIWQKNDGVRKPKPQQTRLFSSVPSRSLLA